MFWTSDDCRCIPSSWIAEQQFLFPQTKFEMNEWIGMYHVHVVEQGNLKVRRNIYRFYWQPSYIVHNHDFTKHILYSWGKGNTAWAFLRIFKVSQWLLYMAEKMVAQWVSLYIHIKFIDIAFTTLGDISS